MKNNWEFFLKKCLYTIKRDHILTPFDITLFLRQFATLIAAGIPLLQCCDLLEKSQVKITLKHLVFTIKRDILIGKSLFTTFSGYPHYFDKLTCQLIKMGEHTGKLDTMLMIIAHQKEKNLAFKKRIQQALFYPAIITLTACIITLGMFIFVVPKFKALFQDIEGELPLLTIGIFYLALQLKKYVSIFILCVVLCIFSFVGVRKTYYLRSYFLYILCKLPLIKSCVKKILLAQFVRHLAITLSSGLPIIDALRLSATISDDIEFNHCMTMLINKITTGLQLHDVMKTVSYFPLFMIQMIKVGEDAGKLELMLDKIAEFLEADIEQFISHVNKLLEPLIMVVLGVLIGGLVIGMYLPLFKLGNRF